MLYVVVGLIDFVVLAALGFIVNAMAKAQGRELMDELRSRVQVMGARHASMSRLSTEIWKYTVSLVAILGSLFMAYAFTLSTPVPALGGMIAHWVLIVLYSMYRPVLARNYAYLFLWEELENLPRSGGPRLVK